MRAEGARGGRRVATGDLTDVGGVSTDTLAESADLTMAVIRAGCRARPPLSNIVLFAVLLPLASCG
jgi:hypothetical protein